MQINYAITQEAERNGASQVGPDGTLGLFYNKPVMDNEQSQIEGRPVFNSVPFVKMRFPGEGKKVLDRAARDVDRQRFPAAWKAFQEGQAGPTDGTPIETFPLLSITQVAAFKHLGIVTVEQLAQVHDGNLSQLGIGGQQLRERAKAWLQGSEAEVKTMRAQMLELQKQMENLRAQNEVLKAEMTKAPAPPETPKRGPGRPRKAEANGGDLVEALGAGLDED